MKTTILCLLLALAVQTAAFPCSCMPRPSVAEAFAEANAVFAGRCISAKLLPARDEEFPFERCQFIFEVTRVWKGTAEKKQVTVETGAGGGDCGYRFAIGASYILYCNEADGMLFTDICMRTCDIDHGWRAEAEMKQLDDAKAKTK
jgi:hypothetical protein